MRLAELAARECDGEDAFSFPVLIVAIRQTLARVNQERIAAGETADAVAPDALAAADNAHTMLATGLAQYR